MQFATDGSGVGGVSQEYKEMCKVRIIEHQRSCRVLCECGYDAVVVVAPDTCPACGQAWERPNFEEGPFNAQQACC